MRISTRVFVVVFLLFLFVSAASGGTYRFAILVENEPLITEHDIEAFSWGKQKVQLDDAAVRRLSALPQDWLANPKPFDVVVDGEPVYSGHIWWAHYSAQPRGPVIMWWPGGVVRDRLRISTILDKGEDDVRFNVRLRSLLKELELLVE